MSRFNSSISTLGISEAKVQQAILKLLENSLYQRELLGKTGDGLTEQIRRIRQQMAALDRESATISVFGRDLGGRSFAMRDIVGESDRTYSVQVSFINNTDTAQSCTANGTAVEAMASSTTRSPVFTVEGTGSFTVDNNSADVDVIVRAWR